MSVALADSLRRRKVKVLQLENNHVFYTNIPDSIRNELEKYWDDGRLSGGTAWLPSEPLSNEANELLIAHNWGSMVEVKFANDQAVASLGNAILEKNWAENDNLFDALCAIATERHPRGWAHFGIFGASNSKWVLAL